MHFETELFTKTSEVQNDALSCDKEQAFVKVQTIFLIHIFTSNLPNKLSSNSAAGHSGLLTVERRS